MLLGLGLNRGGVMAWRSGSELLGGSAQPGAGGGGVPARTVAERFRVSVSYIYKALGRRKATGETEARPQRNHQELKLAAYHDAIRAEVARRPDVTLNELRAWLQATDGVSASLGLMHRTLARLGLTRKKRMARPICKGDERRRAGLHQRIRSQGTGPGQDGSRASQAS
jgi:transposase